MEYECIVVGGGIAGLQAAIQLGRYKHQVLVIDSNDGRSSICKGYHNLLGWPDGVSGKTLRDLGRSHAKKLNVTFLIDTVERIRRGDHSFIITVRTGDEFVAKRLLLATGVMDRLPPFPEIIPCLGMSVFVCPDCDGYEVKNKRTIVLGSGNTGANMALTLSYWTNEILYINHEQTAVDRELIEKMEEKHIDYFNQPIRVVRVENGQLQGVVLKNGENIQGNYGFIAFGGNDVRSDLARSLGVKLHENKHIVTDARTKMTNVEYVWAAGDVVAHSEQVTIAMGEGSQAAIWIHKSLIQKG